ncbi:MAG: aminotransferase class I/II-fold pyridoxal phosphate-dependent enzyme [Elusimicrobia bacterium]|nr:aminotransferase class I/II-fold pyridoxal phosphate-dependent enzyme [Elusimicrobiota bacterium]
MKIDAAVGASPTLAWAAKVAELRRAGRPIVSLGLGEPDFPTPPHVVDAAAKALRDGFTTYSAGAGLPELREAVARKLSRDNGVAAEAGEVVIVPGAKNALFLAAAAVLEPGDEAVHLTPGYVSNLPILKLAEPSCRAVEVALRGPAFDLDLERLEAAVGEKTRLLLLNYPNNPTGRRPSAAEAAGLLSLIRRRPKLIVVSDEIYERLPLGGGTPFSPAAAADIRERVVTVNGFSKSYAMTGWRIGYAHAAAPLAKKISLIHQQINTHTATFIQKAAVAALEGPHDHLDAFVSRLKTNKARYERFLRETPACRGSSPEGGFFAFVDVSAARLASDAFAAALLEETGVAVLPGLSFGAGFDAYCRLSLAVPEDAFSAALDRLAEFVARKAAA